jgi:hypothetical protein
MPLADFDAIRRPITRSNATRDCKGKRRSGDERQEVRSDKTIELPEQRTVALVNQGQLTASSLSPLPPPIKRFVYSHIERIKNDW